MQIKSLFTLWGLVLLVMLMALSCGKESPEGSLDQGYHDRKPDQWPLVLSSACPPGFMLNEDNECVSRSLYQQYESLEGVGVGGLKTALPEVRDGFSPQQIDLGRYLFFDPVLSGNGQLSCASCHDPDKGFADGLPRAVGIKGTPVKRSAPSLWNVAYLKSFFWDARSTSLEEQMKGPLYDPMEMGADSIQLRHRLNTISTYQRLFAEAFPERDPYDSISLNEVYKALAAFECSLISLNSRYDQYAHGNHQALSEKEVEGLNIFRSFVARCAECHTPPLFTNQQVAVIGSPEPGGSPLDPGAEETFDDPTRRGGFKVPSLRNIALTGPYMHSGGFSSLREVVAFYNKGRGHAVPEDEKLYLHWHIWDPELKEEELDRLVDFLQTLTDESFKPEIPEVVPSESEHKSKKQTL